MRIAIGSDNASELTEALLKELSDRGHTTLCFGPMTRPETTRDWPLVGRDVGLAVSQGRADEGIVLCYTGTGVSIAANKVPGIRAALVGDAATAKGARIYNHANVLALSLRATTVPVLKEILDAWFATPIAAGEAQSDWNREQIDRIGALDAKR